jgi:hypothetical protein
MGVTFFLKNVVTLLHSATFRPAVETTKLLLVRREPFRLKQIVPRCAVNNTLPSNALNKHARTVLVPPICTIYLFYSLCARNDAQR